MYSVTCITSLSFSGVQRQWKPVSTFYNAGTWGRILVGVCHDDNSRVSHLSLTKWLTDAITKSTFSLKLSKILFFEIVWPVNSSYATTAFGSYDTKIRWNKKELFHIQTSHHFTPHGRYELNKLTSLPMCGFIAHQLVEHRTGISLRSRARIPLKPRVFQASSFQLLKLEKFTAMIILHFDLEP